MKKANGEKYLETNRKHYQVTEGHPQHPYLDSYAGDFVGGSHCDVVVAVNFTTSLHPCSPCLFICSFDHSFACLSVQLSVCPTVRLSSLSVCPSVRLSVCPSVRLSVYQSVSLSVCPSIHPFGPLLVFDALQYYLDVTVALFCCAFMLLLFNTILMSLLLFSAMLSCC